MTLPEKITTLTESMRIGFDGMVSRHQSELAHKKDGVDIFKSLLTATASLYVALFGLIVSDSVPYYYILSLTWVLCLGSAIFAQSIKSSTNEKIIDDNKGYIKYRIDYMYAVHLLELDRDGKGIRDEVDIDHLKKLRKKINKSEVKDSSNSWEPIGGATVTIRMINNICLAVIAFTVLGASIISAFAISAD